MLRLTETKKLIPAEGLAIQTLPGTDLWFEMMREEEEYEMIADQPWDADDKLGGMVDSITQELSDIEAREREPSAWDEVRKDFKPMTSDFHEALAERAGVEPDEEAAMLKLLEEMREQRADR